MTQRDSHRPLRVLQLTDPHLMADPTGELLGVNTRDSLDAVITEVQREVAREGVGPDLILATGDLAQDSSEQAYQVLRRKLAQFPCPALWIAGNHDDSRLLARIAGAEAGRKHLVMGGWQFVMLDSSVPRKVHGELSPDELAFLENTLADNPALPTLICLHHHPIDIGSGWMDNIGLTNREAFWQVVDRFPQVSAVLWGHIHQELDQSRHRVRLLATPSTCVQFKRGSDGFALEPLAPGYRWLELSASGEMTTEVRRATDFQFELDMNSTGY